jgi:hypothetical protein
VQCLVIDDLYYTMDEDVEGLYIGVKRIVVHIFSKSIFFFTTLGRKMHLVNVNFPNWWECIIVDDKLLPLS